ncbi:MAG: hypothetical protein F4X66_19380 [Chloroflexi bacterium]|nr:hypothetical protein [Chloroflexota bacterium]
MLQHTSPPTYGGRPANFPVTTPTLAIPPTADDLWLHLQRQAAVGDLSTVAVAYGQITLHPHHWERLAHLETGAKLDGRAASIRLSSPYYDRVARQWARLPCREVAL